jgi:hypothetical protein
MKSARCNAILDKCLSGCIDLVDGLLSTVMNVRYITREEPLPLMFGNNRRLRRRGVCEGSGDGWEGPCIRRLTVGSSEMMIVSSDLFA